MTENRKPFDDDYFSTLFDKFRNTLIQADCYTLPSVSQIAIKFNQDPFKILISTLISLRTRDDITLKASIKLFDIAKDSISMEALDLLMIEKAIYPAAFYKRKAINIKEISRILNSEYGGEVPNEKNKLLSLPGVGIKTANLTLNLGFNIDAVCVDCHVHTIVNRLGIVNTKTAEESEGELSKIMPKRFQIPLNELFVIYGQYICTPKRPKCSLCSYNSNCKKTGVRNSL